jgi:hypothetical protein
VKKESQNSDFTTKAKGASKQDLISENAKETQMEKEVEKLGSEFANLLEELTNKKTCKEHGQNVVIICTDFQCSRRFWCGICCVKYKELFTKYMGSMCSINDFLKDNISKLYKIKTFNENEKKELESKINQIMSRNVESFELIWDQIDGMWTYSRKRYTID